jgi:Ca2+-binding EF-hand superfamily protein
MSEEKIPAEIQAFFGEKQIQTFRNAFNAFDEDGDGRNPVSVLGKLLRAVDYLPTVEEVEDMVEAVQESSDEISFKDFAGFVYRHARYANPLLELKNAFRLFDRERTGWLSVEMIKQILRSFKKPLSDTEIGEVLMVADISEDGRVEYAGFVEKLLHL